MTKIVERLYALQDLPYRDFTAPLIPNVPKERIIGVRLPLLKKLAKEIGPEERDAFFAQLPHAYHEEDLLHAFLINRIKDLQETVREIDRFLPYVTNWAVSDTLLPVSFGKNKQDLEEPIQRWISSNRTYTVRFGIYCRMKYFLKEAYRPEHLKEITGITHEDYYVKMMIAWYLATAMINHYEDVLPYLKGDLSEDIRRKAIQKAVESFRIPEERKAELKSLRKKAI